MNETRDLIYEYLTQKGYSEQEARIESSKAESQIRVLARNRPKHSVSALPANDVRIDVKVDNQPPKSITT